ncbi:MAG: hypothetical protein ACD_19C00135G0003, partial [uncultured bacterium]
KEFEKLLVKNISPSSEFLNKKVFQKGFHDILNDFSATVSTVNIDRLGKEDIDKYYTMLNTFTRLRMPYRVSERRDKLEAIRMLRDNKNEYLLTFAFLSGISRDLKRNQFCMQYDLASKDKALFLKGFSIYNDKNLIVGLTFEQTKQNQLELKSFESKYLNTKEIDSKTFQNAKNLFGNQKTIFSFVQGIEGIDVSQESISPLSQTLRNLINLASSETSEYFEDDSINYVSPLRAHPKRYYFLDKAKINVYLDTLDGDAIAEILKENVHLKKQVNTWLNKFNLKVNVEHLEDIIHKVQVNQNSLDLDITDVGFGISQVLPVIIQGFLSHNETLTLIEQPEIHLHPKMQADLADLFIEIVFSNRKKPSKYLLIETHSEYLLKRLRRRISENVISAEDVAIYLVDPDVEAQGAIIKELKVQQKGHFDWPVDFYGGELLKDTTEFLKNQII